MNRVVPWIAVLVVVLTATPARGDASPTPAQVELYDKAREAFERGDHAGAIRLLRSALTLGELNILYLSLGRALFREGQCEEAEAAYVQTLRAPAVVHPPAHEVASRVEAYRADLQRECPGSVVVHCEPATARIRVLGQVTRPCSPSPIALPPGRHVITARVDDRTVSQAVVVTPMQRAEITLRVPGADAAASGAPPPRPFPTGELGMVSLGVGGAILAVSLVIDLTILDGSIDDYERARDRGDPDAAERKADAETLQSWTLAGYITGGLLAAGGAALVILAPSEPGSRSDARGFSVRLGPGGVSARVHF